MLLIKFNELILTILGAVTEEGAEDGATAVDSEQQPPEPEPQPEPMKPLDVTTFYRCLSYT